MEKYCNLVTQLCKLSHTVIQSTHTKADTCKKHNSILRYRKYKQYCKCSKVQCTYIKCGTIGIINVNYPVTGRLWLYKIGKGSNNGCTIISATKPRTL